MTATETKDQPTTASSEPFYGDTEISPTTGEQFMIVKERFSKSYRHPTLDERLVKQRCRMESRLLEKCKNLPTLTKHIPKVLRTEIPILYLEYIEGITVKDFINTIHQKNKLSDPEEASLSLTQVASEMGRLIGTLHAAGIVHGDLTTSNLMIRTISQESQPSNGGDANNMVTKPCDSPGIRLYLIDFGLAKQLKQQKKKHNKNNTNMNLNVVEEMAVDLYVLERALQSTHPQLPNSFLTTLLTAYVVAAQQEEQDDDDDEDEKGKEDDKNNNKPKAKVSSEDEAILLESSATLRRLEQVRQRGRKRDCFG